MLTEVKTNISYGFLELIKVFAKANELDLKIEPLGSVPGLEKIKISYDSESDTAHSITLLSYRNLGFENMLCDYLQRCDIIPEMIPIGRMGVRRDMNKLEEDWEERRKQLGFR